MTVFTAIALAFCFAKTELVGKVPTFVPTRTDRDQLVPTGTKNPQAVGIAGLKWGTPQVGFEPTTLRLTEGSGRLHLTIRNAGSGALPVVRDVAGGMRAHGSAGESPREPPRENARGCWAEALS